jgi:heme oxygenase
MTGADERREHGGPTATEEDRVPLPETTRACRHGLDRTDPQDRLSVALRRATSADHQRIERLLRLPDRLSDVPALRQVLMLWVHLWSDVGVAPHTDGAAAAPADPEDLPAVAVRALNRLAIDLQELAELSPADPATAPTPGAPGTPATPMTPGAAWAGGPLSRLRSDVPGRWGVDYVLRGTLVGGRTVAPTVTRHLRLPEGVGVRYLSAEGEDVGRDWADFRHRLDAWGADASPEQCEAVVDAATTTFHTVQDWAVELFGDTSGAPSRYSHPVPRPRTA